MKRRAFVAALAALTLLSACKVEEQKVAPIKQTVERKNDRDDGPCIGYCFGPRISPSGQLRITPGLGIGL